MPDAISNIGDFFTNAAPAITGATAATGLFGNIMNSITRGKAVGNLEDAEKKFARLTPEQLSSLVSRAEQPLDAGLVQGITNQVQADMASRGLSQAPGILAATESQALAPFKQRNQQVALELVLKQLGLPIEYAQAILNNTGGNANVMNSILSLLMRNANAGGGNEIPPNIPEGDAGVAGTIGDIIFNQSIPTPDFPSTQPGGG